MNVVGIWLLSSVAQIALTDCDVRAVTTAPTPSATVLVRGSKIQAVGTDVAVPDGFDVIRCEGRTLTPGLIDADTQMGLVEVGLDPSSNDSRPESSHPIRAALNPAHAFDLRSTLIAVARSHGVTSVVSAPTGGVVEGQAVWVDLVHGDSRFFEAALVGPVAVVANLGQAGIETVGNSRLSAHAALRQLLDDAKTYRGNKSAFLRRALYPMDVTRSDLEAVQPVLLRRMPLVVEAHRAADIRSVLDLADSYRLDVAILGASEGWLVAGELAAARVPVIVDATMNLPFQLEARNVRRDNIVRMAEAGVQVALSTRSSHNAGNLRFHLGNAVRLGLSPELALRAATQVPAAIFGMDKLGGIEKGQLANLVVWSGDPFEPSSTAETVLIRGERQPLQSRQGRLADRHIQRLGLRGGNKP